MPMNFALGWAVALVPAPVREVQDVGADLQQLREAPLALGGRAAQRREFGYSPARRRKHGREMV